MAKNKAIAIKAQKPEQEDAVSIWEKLGAG
jgi:hypothetical protein